MTTPNRTAQRRQADKLFSQRIRSRGVCQAFGFDGIKCAGVLQCAHVVRRRYLSVRWDDDNAACLCQAHHVYFTHRQIAERRFHEQLLGPERFAALELRAEKAVGAPDYDAILARLKGVAVTTTS